jgi:hypothetical protein
MLVALPTIPVPNLPKVSNSSSIQEGPSTSSSKVTTCVNGNCTTEERVSTGSSYLKVTTISDNEKTTTTVESTTLPDNQIAKVSLNKEAENTIKRIENVVNDYLKKLLQRIIHLFKQ